MTETKIKLSIDGVQTVVSGMKQVGETVGDLSDSLTALTAIGGSLSLGAFAAMVKASIDAADNLNDLSKTTNISVEQLAGLNLAARQSGTELDGVAKAISKLTVSMGKDAEKFAAVGISAKDPIEAFKQLADVAKSVQDPQQKAAFLSEALGKSWESVAPLLNEGSEKIGQMVDQGTRLSSVTQDMADQSDAFNDALVVLDTAMGGFKTRMAADVLPLLNVLIGDFADTAEKTRDLTASFNPLTETLRALVVLGGNVSFVFKAVGTEIGGIAAQIAALSTGDIAGFLAIGKMMKNDAKSAREAFDAWEKRVMESGPKVTQQAEQVDSELDRIRARSAAANAARMRDFVAGNEASTKAAAEAKKAAAEAAREDQARARLLADLNGINADYAEQLARINAMRQAGNISEAQYADLMEMQFARQPAVKKMIDDERKARDELAKAGEKLIADGGKEVEALEAQLAAQREHTAAIGLSAEEVARLTAFKLNLSAAGDEEMASNLRNAAVYAGSLHDAYVQHAADLEKTAKLKREQAGEMVDAASRQRALDDARKVNDEWQDIFESIDETARDTFVSIFDSGKSAFDRLEDALKNGLYDLLYQMTVRQWIFQIGASISGTSDGSGQATGASGGLSQGLGYANNARSAYSAYGSIGGYLEAAGTAIGSTSLAGFGAGWSATTGASTANAAMLASAQTAGNVSVAASLGSTVAAAIPYVAIVAAVWAIVSSMDDSGTMHTGGAGSYSAAAGGAMLDSRSLGTMSVVPTQAANEATQAVAKSIVTILDGTAEAFGKQVGFSAATAFADDTSKDGAWGALRIERNGQKLIDWADSPTSRWAPREFADGEQGHLEYMQTLGDSMIDVLRGMDLPGWANQMLAQLGETPSVQALGEVIGQINAVQAAFKNIGGAITGFVSLTDAAKTALVNAAGGVDALVSGLNAYYDGYYSEAEKMANVSKQVEQSLARFNITMPTTREEFRAIVEAQMAMGEAAAPAVAELLRVAGAFGTVADYSKQLAEQAIAEAQAKADAEKARAEAEAKANEEAAARIRDAQQQAWDTAIQHVGADLEALQRSVNAQRDVLQASHKQTMDALAGQMDVVNGRIGKLSSLSNSLRSTVDGLRLPGDSAVNRASAQAEIAAALAIARAAGVFPEADQLSRALRVVAEPSEQLFETFEDYQRDALRTSNTIAELAALTDDQLSVEERTYDSLEQQRMAAEASHAAELQRLDDIVGNAQLQYDVLLGLDTTLKPLPEAMQALATSISRVPAAPTNSGAGSSAGTPSGNSSFVESLYGTFLGRVSDAPGLADWVGKLDAGSLTRAEVFAGFTNSDEYKRLNNIPSFDIGTNYVQKDMLAMIHEGEAIVPKAYNPAAGGRMLTAAGGQQSNADVVVAIGRLDERLSRIEANTARGADGSQKAGNALERSSAGGPLLVRVAPT